MKTAKVIAAAICGFGIASIAASATLVSNIYEPIRSLNNISSSLWAAQSFVTDGRLSILVNVRAQVGDETGPTTPFAELRTADFLGHMDPSPAGLVATFYIPDLTGTRSDRTFLPDRRVWLAPNTKYFFVLGNLTEGPDTFDWSYADTNVWSGPGYLDSYEYTFDGGTTWIPHSNEFPFHLEVNVNWKIPVLWFPAGG